MPNKIKVEIPEEFLLQIATHGNMGTGELADLIRIWAQKECDRNGLSAKVAQMQMEKINELRKSLTNVIGKDMMNTLDEGISKATKAIKDAKSNVPR